MTSPLIEIVAEMRKAVEVRELRDGMVASEAITAWADRLQSLALSGAGEVDDAMVERGCAAAYTELDMGRFPDEAVNPKADRDFVRAALSAYTHPVAPGAGDFTSEAHARLNTQLAIPGSTVTLTKADALALAAAARLPGGGEAVGWVSVAERLPPEAVDVLVYTPDRGDGQGNRISFDGRLEGGWAEHDASYEHYMAVGGAAAAGPNATCTGPHEAAPYTHWMPCPAAPGAATPTPPASPALSEDSP